MLKNQLKTIVLLGSLSAEQLHERSWRPSLLGES
jgi:hypothetical protein